MSKGARLTVVDSRADRPLLPRKEELERYVAQVLSEFGEYTPDFVAAGLATSIIGTPDYRYIIGIALEQHARGLVPQWPLIRATMLSGSVTLEDPLAFEGFTDGVPRPIRSNIPTIVGEIRDAAECRRLLLRLHGGENPHAAAMDFLSSTQTLVHTPIVGMTMAELASHQFARRRPLICRGDMPILRQGDISQVHGFRGLGKTWFADTLALIGATGTDAMGFSAPEPCRVLNVDGEMAGEEKQGRQAVVAGALNVLPTDNLVTVAADWQPGFLPRIDTAEGQAAIEPFVALADLVIFDNRSSLCDPESEKDPVAWQAAQNYALSLRRRGKTTIFVHHSNRQGGARGHSKPEDVMNLIIKLSRPEDYHTDQGARFTVEFEKTRGAHGAAVRPFTTQLTSSGWLIEADEAGGVATNVAGKIRDYLRLAAAAGERPKSANAAITATRVNRNAGLKAWADLLHRGEIHKHASGGFTLTAGEDEEATS